MPQYVKSPFRPSPILMTSGRPAYLFGSYSDKTSPTQGNVISNSAVTTTGTLTFQITAGYALQTASLNGETITVVGCQNSSNFNVTNATILTAVTNFTTGVCTVTYAITSTSQSTTVDVGMVLCSVPEVPESYASTAAPVASFPVAVPFNNPEQQQGRTLTAFVTLSGTFTGVAVDLQEAEQDIDSEYVTLVPATGGTSSHLVNTTSSAGVYTATYQFLAGRFYRFNVSAIASGTVSVVGKING